MSCCCSQAVWQTLSSPVSEFRVAGPPEVIVSSPTPFCSCIRVLTLGATVGFRGFELLGRFSVCYFKNTLGRRKKIKFAKSQLNMKMMNASGLCGLCSSALHVMISNSALITESHTTFSIRPLPCSLNRLDNVQLMSSYSISCILLIAQCMVLCLHCWLLFIPCSEYIITHFLQSFSVVLITIISKCFINIV